MNCIIVDDDESSRCVLKHLVSQIQYLNLVGICCNATETLNVLNNTKTDLMFLDIEMPDMSGIQLVRSLKNPPMTILTTSKNDCAVEAFECNVIDYVMKPIYLDRFFKAIAKAKDIFDSTKHHFESHEKEFIFIKVNRQLIKINYKEILWIEALGDYITINTSERKYTVHSTMKTIESKLDSHTFIRVHRSFIVSINQITLVDDSTIVIGKQLIPIGGVYKEHFAKKLNLLN